MPQDKLSIEDLVAIAKTNSDETIAAAQIDQRLLKDIELFIAEFQIKSGKKKIHNLVIFALYKSWLPTSTMTKDEFMKAFGYFFPKVLNSQRGVCFQLTPKLSNKRKFNTSSEHFKECRLLYGKKAQNEKTEIETSGT